MNVGVWVKGATYGDVVSLYVKYVKNRYANCIVVFDGYPEYSQDKSTQYVERARRNAKALAPEILLLLFDETMTSIDKQKFLNNEKNKVRLIKFVSERLES